MMRGAELLTLLPGPPELSPFFPVLRTRILHRHDSSGWEGLVERVVALAGQAEDIFGEPDRNQYLQQLTKLLRRGGFLPNSPLLVNAAESTRSLFACFALDASAPPERFISVVRAVHNGMGGVGYALDHIPRPLNVARFITFVDDDTGKHQKGRPRPASNAATIDLLHPAAAELLKLAGTLRFTNLNVGVTDAFMSELAAGSAASRGLFADVVKSIHATGQPGVVFTDRIPRIAGEAEPTFSTNVCGEAPLAADESGLLGSLNLLQFLTIDEAGLFRLDEEQFVLAVRVATRFLDGMHDLHQHPSERLRANSLATRKIGVGIMGLAQYLALIGCRYGGQASLEAVGRVGRLLSHAANAESKRLGTARGVFPAWRSAMPIPGRRNAMTVAIAGTATLALLVGTTGGIEPIFSLMARHRVMGHEVPCFDAAVRVLCERAGLDATAVQSRLLAGAPTAKVLGVELADLLPTAHEVPGHEHVLVQAALQREIDGGITKTINCAADTSAEEMGNWLRLAHRQGRLGLTIYRANTLPDQPVQQATATVEGA